MIHKYLYRLIVKFFSIQLVVTVAVAHFCRMQLIVAQDGDGMDCTLSVVCWELGQWCVRMDNTVFWPAHLSDIVLWGSTHLGLYNTPGVGTGVIWIGPDGKGTNIVWYSPWHSYITNALVLETNPGKTHTNYDLVLASLILHESALLSVTPNVVISAPHSVLYNTPTLSWSIDGNYRVIGLFLPW